MGRQSRTKWMKRAIRAVKQARIWGLYRNHPKFQRANSILENRTDVGRTR